MQETIIVLEQCLANWFEKELARTEVCSYKESDEYDEDQIPCLTDRILIRIQSRPYTIAVTCHPMDQDVHGEECDLAARSHLKSIELQVPLEKHLPLAGIAKCMVTNLQIHCPQQPIQIHLKILQRKLSLSPGSSSSSPQLSLFLRIGPPSPSRCLDFSTGATDLEKSSW